MSETKIDFISMHIIDTQTRKVYANVFLERSEANLPIPFPNTGDQIVNDGKVLRVVSRTFDISSERYAVTLMVKPI